MLPPSRLARARPVRRGRDDRARRRRDRRRRVRPAARTLAVLVPLGVGVLGAVRRRRACSRRVWSGRSPRSSAGPRRSLGGSAGRLARENSVRNPGRTASTAAALMIGLALVTVVATLGAGLRGSIARRGRQADPRRLRRDRRRQRRRPASSRSRPAEALATTPGVTVASSVRSDKARVLGDDDRRRRRRPGDDRPRLHFDWKRGSGLAGLGHGGAIVPDGYAEDHDLEIGSRLTLQTSSGSQAATLTVTAIYKPAGRRASARRRRDRPADVRRGVPAPAERLHVRGTASSTAAPRRRPLARYPDAKLDDQGRVGSRAAQKGSTRS